MSGETFTITIDQRPVDVVAGETVLKAAARIGIKIPTLCYLEKCGPLNSCQVCLVKINGRLVPSCGTVSEAGMSVESESVEVHEARRTALELLFSDHVGDCLAPCNRLCPLRLNIPVMLRETEEGRIQQAISTVFEALPLPGVLGALCHHPCEQGCRRGQWDDPAAIRAIEKHLADEHRQSKTPYIPSRKPASGKSVVIVGAGPAGLSAAWSLLRQGHSVTVADRHSQAGGTLTSVPPRHLPEEVLAGETRQLASLGLQFRFGSELGRDLTLDGLLRGFDAVILAVGGITPAEAQSYGLESSSAGIKAQAETFETSRKAVFACGRAVREMTQVLRAISDGQSAATCVNQFLMGSPIRKTPKPFSSIMGRVGRTELKLFLRSTSTSSSTTPCNPSAGLDRREASLESSRCLHCDCRSSGSCALQTYAQTYGVDASRFRSQRRNFEQQVQPGGVIFEPGKCILCGICVKLTEIAREPLGLAFIGRGFNVRVSAPFNRSIEDGLRQTAEECVKHCPTGALSWK
jgi:NADPH-dependent glutamate synthase beta subunit-like oxidoreductase/ferredoxin